MSPIGHLILADATSKKLNTPLKASVVLISSVILASCGSDGSSSYYSSPTPIVDDEKSETGNGNEGNQDTGDTDSSTDNQDESTDNQDDTKGDTTDPEATDPSDESTDDEKDDASESDALEKAQAEAEKSRQEAQQLKEELEKVKAEAEQAKAEAEQAKKELEEALNSGSGNSEALQAAAEEKAKQAEKALQDLQAAEAAAQEAIAAAEAKEKQAQDVINAAAEAQDAAEIKNAPESAKSGVQTLNVDVAPLSKVFKTTTRDFSADDNSVVARADLASQDPTTPDKPGLLGELTITTSGEGDTDVAGTNGFKAHDDNAIVGALGQELPLSYTSTYKDFGDDMRIGHIDGKAVFSGIELPVNGAAVIGNATQAQNMPTEGTVGYTGDATHRKLGLGNAIEFGSSVFTADFVNKNLEGKLSFDKAGDIALKAGIDGNQFSGAAADNDGYATEGGFYGGDAQYLGGVYEGNGAQGTYGAKSDAQTAAEQAAVDAQAKADAAQAAIAEQQAKADAAKAAAEKAQADAQKAQAALEKAQENLANAGEGGDGGLANALARAEAAEAAQAAAEELAAKAQAAQKAAEQAKAAAESAQAAAEQAADKAVGEAKAEADKLVAAAKAEAEAANEAAQTAKAEADAANAAADKAKTDAEALVAEANKQKEQAEADALQAQKEADAANKLAAAEKAKAEAAQKEAETAKSELADAQKALEEAEQALADALASGGGNTEALQAEVDRRQAALDAANEEAAAAQQAAADAIAAAQKQVEDAQAALQAATDAAAAAEIKNAPESAKSGVQTLNVDVAPLSKVFKTTTRDFSADDNSVVARADLASQDPTTPDKPGLLGELTITTSGEGDTDVAGTNGFKAHDDNAIVGALGQELPLSYTSTYKDFGDDMRIGHIDGKAVFSGIELPVNGAAVIGNATQAQNMPTEGTVGYTGDATHRKLGLGNAIEFGSSVFTADFVNKNLEGKLSFDKAGDIALKAGIDGNQFSGAAADNDGYATEGGFYGGDAQYLGGVYEGNGAQGTYGAKSDAQTAAEQAAVDAQAKADAAQAAIAEQQAKADAAKAAAEKAQADAQKAQAALEKAQENLANAGEGGDGGLANALARAEAAEAAQAAAEELAAKAQAAQKAAEQAKAAAESAQAAAEQAADKAVGEAKAEADKLVAAAKAEAEAANEAAQTAKAEADAANAAADKAKTDAEALVAEANKQKEQAEADALQAQKEADAANKLAAAEKAKAEAAQKEAETAKSELADAQKALEEAEQALADALASGGGNTEALQAEVDRRQAALDAANEEAAAAQQAAADAIAAAQKQVEDAQAALQAATDAAAAAEIKNAPESAKSGVQTLNVDVAPLSKVFKTTTRDFSADDNSVVARADLASQDPTTPDKPGLLGELTITTSGEGDTDVAGTNGFKAHDDNAIVGALGQELPLSYTSTYKDFGDDMRIGHIDGKAVFSGIELPVNGAAVIGNATQAQNMPTEGTVGYTGDATHRKLGLGNAIEFGSSVFTADFVNKNLEGKLSFDKAGDIALKAGIDGNQFSGAAADNAGYATEGGFYGGDAQYLGGVYEGNGAQGTYGAKSDAQTAAEQAAVDAQAKAEAAQAAIAEQQAKADAAKAAAEKAQADAQKAQAALEKAQENLANAGDGESALESALERARLAEEAQQAAEEVATKAQAAEAAAKEAQATAEKAQQTAEQAALDAKAAADKAIGDAKAEADKLVAEANTAADAAKAEADQARVAAEKAKDDVIKANTARDEALAAKAEAEKRAKEAEDALAASKELPPAPENPEVAASSTITGVQSNNLDGHRETKRGDIVDNNTSSFDILSSRVNELDTRYASEAINLTLRDKASDQAYNGNKDGFKVHTGKVIVPGVGQVNESKSRDLNYTSVYNNFNEDMQIGHVYGVIDRTLYADGKLSTVYAQGKSTSAEDMKYMKELSQYNIDNKLNDGKVNYEGVATYMENGNVEGPVLGSSKFNVDFVDQQVDGSLSFAGMSDKKLKAEITGNKFAGNWNGLDTQGGFYGNDADLLGGVYSDSKGKGTYGAEKVAPPAPVDPVDPTEPTEPTGPVNPDVAPDAEMTGFQSTALSSTKRTLPFGAGELENAIGYVAIRNDKSNWSGNQDDLVDKDGTLVPVDTENGDNFTAFNKLSLRADMVKPDTVQKQIDIALDTPKKVVVEAGKGGLNPDFVYKSVYESFDTQMQVGHVYGHINSGFVGDLSRVANVYVQGHLTAQEDIDYLKEVNDGKATYAGSATYIENIHLGDGNNDAFAPVNGSSNFDVDFVNNSVKGELAFDGDFKYMPEGNKIGIEATIDGNTFAGNVNGIDTAGGFYGEDAQFLGGIYQDASVEGGKGDVAGTGTKFQGTFGAEKQ
ncbi:transferrin-binding protein-like solute binding protein [Psychrobacter sp. FDAARGOS_221]|uniref:transferrin-binding protein-like solute binding protein n=1 Tax=Psychrobacter sp. FDAARGOS_221 TaxID=1975705 RepID=UPI000BB590EB|nr:transferrin-binding protein-like solute binding protein [Psychrobacter sp. FDAARGOS_221]PNK61228.1 hypothetical protein A6J60_010325 [Psychrobacter sp. FDAARGOS_221]